MTAPVNEEIGKGVGLILLLGLAPRLVRSPYDGFIIGAYIGLGFEVVEDVLYVFNGAAQSFGVDQLSSSLKIFLVRGVSGVVSHALFSALFCAGLMWVITRTTGQRHRVRGVFTMVTAMVFHFGWDDLSGLAAGSNYAYTVLIPGLIVLEVAALSLVLKHAAAGERQWMRSILQPEVDAGIIDAELCDAVSGLRDQRNAYASQFRVRRDAGHLIAAAHDLAQAIAEGAGVDTLELQHARAEVGRLSSRRSRPVEPPG